MKEMRILVVNPNSTQSMTDALKPQIESMGFSQTIYSYFTAPSGPRSINDDVDVRSSVAACLPSLAELLTANPYDGVLVACYSVHPLVFELRDKTTVPVIGIFEASVTASLSLAATSNDRFGIVSTGKVWEKLLSDGVQNYFLTTGSTGRFAGVETTGLNATELHDLPAEQVDMKMREATRRLILKSDETVKAICLGCAGMVGLEQSVRQACIDHLGADGAKIHIVDGVKAGVGILQMLIRGGF